MIDGVEVYPLSRREDERGEQRRKRAEGEPPVPQDAQPPVERTAVAGRHGRSREEAGRRQDGVPGEWADGAAQPGQQRAHDRPGRWVGAITTPLADLERLRDRAAR